MPITRDQLGIQSQRAKSDVVAQPKSGKQVLFQINKGGKKVKYKDKQGKEKIKMGPDLNTHFRLTPEDSEQNFVVDFGQGVEKLDLAQIFSHLYENEPGSSAKRIKVRIENLDVPLRMASAYLSNGRSDKFKEQLMRWSIIKAQVMRRSGGPMDVCLLSPNGRSVVMERWGLKTQYYEDGENPIETNDRIVENTPADAGKMFIDDGKKMPLQALCYIYESNPELAKEMLCMFRYSGKLELTFCDLLVFGIPGVGVLTTHAASDITSINNALLPVAERCANLGVPLSQIEFLMWREMEEINRPSFGDNSKSIDARRLEGGKKKNGTVRLQITQESNLLLTNLEYQKGNQLVQLAARNVGLLESSNTDLFGSDQNQKQLPPPALDVVGVYDEYVDEGNIIEMEEVDEVVAEIAEQIVDKQAVDWQSHADQVHQKNQGDMLELFSSIWGITKQEAFEELKATEKKWGRSSVPMKKQIWEDMNMHMDQ